MKKVFNWTFGAFFRTIGRIFGYLCIGILFLVIGSKLDLKLPLNLFMKVNAAEVTTNVSYARSGVINVPYEQKFDNSWIYKDFSSTTGITRQQFQINFTDILESDDVDYIEFTMLTSEPTQTELTSDSKGRYCNKYSSEFSGYVEGNIPTYDYTCQSYYEYKSGEVTTIVNNDYKLTNFNIYVITTDDQYLSCTITSTGKVQCPTNRKKLKSIVTHFIFKTNHIAHMRYAINIDYNLYIDSNSRVQGSVDNIKDSTNDIKDSINNDNVDDSSGTASGFFNDFSDNGHGLSGIVTAPLNAVNAMLSTTCTAPSATYKNKTFSLPCGDILWNQEGASNFKNILNLFYGGIICFGILKSLFKDVNDLKNPDNDKVEVVDL